MDSNKTDRDILIDMLVQVTENRKDTQALTEQVKIANGRTRVNEKAIKSLGDEHNKVKTIFGTLSVLLTGAWGVITFIIK